MHPTGDTSSICANKLRAVLLLLVAVNFISLFHRNQAMKMCKNMTRKTAVCLHSLLPTWDCYGENNNITQVYYCFWYCYDSETELCWENRLSSTVCQSVLATWTEVVAVQQYFLETSIFFFCFWSNCSPWNLTIVKLIPCWWYSKKCGFNTVMPFVLVKLFTCHHKSDECSHNQIKTVLWY